MSNQNSDVILIFTLLYMACISQMSAFKISSLIFF